MWSRPDRVLASCCGCVLAPGRRTQGAKKARANVLGVWMAAWLQGGLTPPASAPAPALLDPGCVAPGHTGEPQGLWLRVCCSGMGQVPRGSCGGEGLRGQLGRSPPSVHGQTSSHGPFQSCTDFSFLNFTSRHKFGQESRWGNRDCRESVACTSAVWNQEGDDSERNARAAGVFSAGHSWACPSFHSLVPPSTFALTLSQSFPFWPSDPSPWA